MIPPESGQLPRYPGNIAAPKTTFRVLNQSSWLWIVLGERDLFDRLIRHFEFTDIKIYDLVFHKLLMST